MWVSPNDRIAVCAHTMPTIPSRHLQHDPTPWRRPTDTRVPSTPRGTSAPIPAVTIKDWLGLGNLRANGHPSSGPWRQLSCRSCHGYFLETHGTLVHGQRLSGELLVRVLACLVEGLGIRAAARVFEVDPNPFRSISHTL